MHQWVRNLPGPETVIVSVLGEKQDGTSEFSFYPYRGGFDDAETGKPSWEEWLAANHPKLHIEVFDHPTIDYQRVPDDTVVRVVADIRAALSAGKTVVLVDSGGQQRTGKIVKKHMGLAEKFG